MKLLDIIKTVGAGAVRELVPGGGILINAVNEMLPEQHRLPQSATGQDVENALSGLDSEQRAAILNKEFDVEIAQVQERGNTVRAMLEADATAKHTTRPYIAKHAFHVVAVAMLAAVLAWAWGVFASDDQMVRTVMEGWPFILSVIGPFVVLLRAYFGVLRDEDRNRRNAANGKVTESGIGSFMSNVLKKGR